MILFTRGVAADVLRAAIPPGVVVTLLVVLLRFPPEQYGFYPACPLHEILGLQCPGCGATRALAALLHGHLVQALHFNALTTLLLPFALAYAIPYYRDFLKHRAIRPLQLPSAAIYSAITLAVLFTVYRNLPVRAF